MSRIPERVIQAVIDRADGHCEACSFGLAYGAVAFHHRLPRSGGGKDEAVNLMLVHGGITGGCHNLGPLSIHGSPARSYDLGHLVRRGTDPADVPVLTDPTIRRWAA